MAQRAPRRDLSSKKAPTATGAFLRFLFYGYVSMLTLWKEMASEGFWFSSTAARAMASTPSKPSYTCPRTVTVQSR